MAAADLPHAGIQPDASVDVSFLLDVLEQALHSASSEWLFFRELKVAIGQRNGSLQRLDAFALNCLPHQAMRRICYEVKVSRADFQTEIRQPLKRRIGMRFSNEFYFVAPAGLLDASEIPVGCGLVEITKRPADFSTAFSNKEAGLAFCDPVSAYSCSVTVPACWRDTEGPTWQFAAAMVRNQRRAFQERPPAPPKQQKLALL